MSAASAETTPKDTLSRSFALLTDTCDAACCYAEAGLYTSRYLEVMRKAILDNLRMNPEPDSRIQELFNGRVGTLAEVEALTARELYAANTCQVISSFPEKYRYSTFQILKTHNLSDDEVEFFVRLSGLKASPEMTEEAFYRFVREDGEWRIDQ